MVLGSHDLKHETSKTTGGEGGGRPDESLVEKQTSLETHQGIPKPACSSMLELIQPSSL